MEGGIRTNAADAAGAAENLAAAHRALKADPAIQFTLQTAPPPAEAPAWLKALIEWLREALRPVGQFFRWIDSLMPDAPYARIFMWSVLIAAAVLLFWLLYTRLREGEWRLPKRHGAHPIGRAPDEEEWMPEAAPARAWLEEADALARQGRFAEAIHHLLFRSIEDIARRRPRLVRPALTSRELASAAILPPSVQTLFSRIAMLVERSLFGKRPVAQDDWQSARDAYADLILAKNWRA